jgi:hypothetical protein
VEKERDGRPESMAGGREACWLGEGEWLDTMLDWKP